LSLAQERPFRPQTEFREKTAWKMPTRNAAAAEKAAADLRKLFKESDTVHKKELHDLMFEATRTLLHMAKDRRQFSTIERTNFYKMANIYNKLKTEFAREL